MFCFDFCKMTTWRSNELIGYVVLMIFREIWSEHSLVDKEQKSVGLFFFILNTFLVAASNATRYLNFSRVEFHRSIKR